MSEIIEKLSNQSVSELKNFCRRFNLRGYSQLKKDGIVDMIADNVDEKSLRLALGLAAPESAVEAVKEEVSEATHIATIVHQFLDEMEIERTKSMKEKDVEQQVLSSLRTFLKAKDVNLDTQAQVGATGRTAVKIPDIQIGNGMIAIEIKYVHGTGDIDRACRQALQYSDLCEELLFLVYDPENKFKKEFPNGFSMLPGVRTILRSH